MAGQNQTATIETSKKWTLSKSDFWRSGLTTLYVSITTILLQFIDAAVTALTTSGSLQFNWANLLLTLKIAIGTWIGDSLRRLVKDSVTVIKVKPPIKQTQTDDDEGERPPVPPTKPEPPPVP